MGGIGFGLVIVKEMIEVYGGFIWVKSEEGKGIIIYFMLLMVVDEEDDWE